MKKFKLLMLGTIAPLSAVLPLVAITSCNDGSEEPVTNKFVCEDSEQTTVRGEIACWYIFDYKGSKDIPDDIDVSFLVGSPKLNPVLLVQKINEKTIKVGVQGIKAELNDKEKVQFVLKFESKELGIEDQHIDCKYTYLESKIRAVSPMVEERQNTISEFRVDAVFQLTDTIDKDKLLIQIENVTTSDDTKIGKPICEGSFEDVTGNIQHAIKVEKQGAWTDGDWVQFDIHFVYKNGGNSWEQVIAGYTYQVLAISYTEDNLDKECDIQIDIKGNTVKGLKAVDANENGILPAGTEVNSPFEMTFNRSESPSEWPDSYVHFYKFGSFVDPTKYSGGYHKYVSVIVYLVKSDNTIQQLTQTYTGDRSGEYGDWWISTGGPITVIRNKLDTIDKDWKSIIFQLRTAQEIKNDSSFYITYSDK